MGILSLLGKLTSDERVERVVRSFADQAVADWNNLRRGKSVADSENHALDVYVEPNISVRVRTTKIRDSEEQDRLEQEEWGLVPHATPDGFMRLPAGINDLIANYILDDGGRVVIYEDAGAGKTVFTWRLREALSSLDTPCLALRFEKIWPTDIYDKIVALLSNACKVEGCDPADVAHKLLQARRVVLILDAADQQSEQFLRNEFQAAISYDTKPELAALIRIVVTSRAFRVREQEQHLFLAARWHHACVELFDWDKQADFKRQLSREVQAQWERLVPSEDRFGDQLRFPEVLKMIREIAADSEAASRPPFERRADLYLTVSDRRLKRAFKTSPQNATTLIPKLKKALGCLAFEMMLKTRTHYGYAAPGDQAEAVRIGAFSRFARTYPASTPAVDALVQKDWEACEEILKRTELTDRSILENNDTRLLSFRSLKMLEFFTGWYMANFTNKQDMAELRKHVGKESWYWPWRFAIELPSAHEKVEPFSVEGLCNAINALLRAPARAFRRPTELMYLAWELLQTSKFKAKGRKVIRAFQKQFFDILSGEDASAAIAAQCVPHQQLIEKLSVERLQSLDSMQPDREKLSLSKTFVRCPPRGVGLQRFWMGSKVDRTGRELLHEVSLDPFWMSATQVTREQYALFDPNHQAWSDRQFKGKADSRRCPVTYVDWYSAFAFALFTGNRLPSEAEWEYACRAGSTGDYCMANLDGVEQEITEETLSSVAYYDQRGADGRQEVARLHPNGWGLYDVHGNVWEWVADWHGHNYYETKDAKRPNPRGPRSGVSHVVRGGGFNGPQFNLRCANRPSVATTDRDYEYGFRLVHNG